MTRPAGIMPGQRMIAGMCMPPSRTDDFAMEQWCIAQPLAAIVVGEDDERVVGDTSGVNCLQDFADALIGALKHRRVFRTCAGIGVVRLQMRGFADGDRVLTGRLYASARRCNAPTCKKDQRHARGCNRRHGA